LGQLGLDITVSPDQPAYLNVKTMLLPLRYQVCL